MLHANIKNNNDGVLGAGGGLGHHLSREPHEEVAEESARGALGITGHKGELAVREAPGAVQDPAQCVCHQQCLWDGEGVRGTQHPWAPPGAPLFAHTKQLLKRKAMLREVQPPTKCLSSRTLTPPQHP